MPITLSNETYYKIEEVAIKFNVHIQTIHRWIKKGLIKVKMISPRKFYISESDIYNFMEGINGKTKIK